MLLDPLFNEKAMPLSVLNSKVSPDGIQRGSFNALKLTSPWNVSDHALMYLCANGVVGSKFVFDTDLFTFRCNDEDFYLWKELCKNREEFEWFIYFLCQRNVCNVQVTDSDVDAEKENSIHSLVVKRNRIKLSNEINERLQSLLHSKDLKLHEAYSEVYEIYKKQYASLYKEFDADKQKHCNGVYPF